MNILKNTRWHKTFWETRKIDWKTSYLDTWNHPHRNHITAILSQLVWSSLFEVGCGSGANIRNIISKFKGVQLGGCDINKDAIDLANESFKGAFFKRCPADDIMMSDSSVDVVLSDMCLIYYSNPDPAIKEMKRVARSYVLFCELHSPTWYGRMKLRYKSGYIAHNYKRLLEKHGFEDIQLIKFGPGVWDGGNPQKDYGYFILAKVPNRK